MKSSSMSPAQTPSATEASNGVAPLIRSLLENIGEDPDREGLIKTPERFEKSIAYLTSGYNASEEEILSGAIFHEQCDEMIILREVDLFSLCEHHLLPFYGKCHVAYVPDGKIIGLSKIPRIIELFSRRLQIQERLTNQIAECLNRNLKPKGVAVVIEALHLCMAMRGVEKQNSITLTSSMKGCFKTNNSTRMEFLSLLRSNSGP